jgi:HAMP domain-containing protein
MGWPERLDAMERALERAAQTVEYGTPADHTPLPPADEPLPAELVPRAQALLDATRAMEDRVRDAAAEVGAQLERIHRAPRPAPGGDVRQPAAYVDTRA